ncbi:caspase family protein [Maridesulfovibrio sp.]|uniref:caspase family protein n=1 Tax=Maridesulfovibrio sp. TaxID=2795000 RepID=UPI002A18ADA6|nr:caspase family protein [Maridesulfovibrio sp.]
MFIFSISGRALAFKVRTIRKLFLFFFGFVLLAALTSCLPPPKYQDPLADLNTTPTSVRAFDDMRLGLLFSGNVQLSRDFILKNRKAMDIGFLTNTAAMNDLDVDYVEKNLQKILSRSFGEVIKVDSLEQANFMNLDVVMLFDMQIDLGATSGAQTSVDLKGSFLDWDRRVLADIAGHGVGVVPFPANSFGYTEAAGRALKALNDELTTSRKLTTAFEDINEPVVVVTAVPAPVAVKGERHALVMGNSAYQNAPLKNPVNDARDVGKALRRLGFNVIMVNNARLREMEQAMDRFYASLQKGGVGLFYYAGHGMQVGGRNYLIPVDATIRSESDVRYECLDAGRILGKMEDAGNALNIVILDACRNNPFARSFRSAQRGLARMDAPTGSIVAYSTAPGSVAADGSGRNGVYTKYLLQYLMQPGLDISDVFFYTRKGVVQETGGEQVPWESSSLVDRFYFSE